MTRILAIIAILAAAGTASAQEQINPSHAYSVRFVCGASSEAFQEGVVRGMHATSINLHNPSRTRSVNFTKRVARALPFQRSDEGSPTVVDTLPPGTAIDVECNEIRMLLPVSMAAQFRSGVLELRATGPVDVTVVYTARPRDGEVSTIDMETVAGVEIGRPDDGTLPDLVPQIDIGTLQVDCPNGSGSCRARVTVRVVNQGDGGAGASVLRTVFDPRQSIVVDSPVPALAPGAVFDADVSAFTRGNCFDPDCQVCATADVDMSVAESDEGNNMTCEERQG